MDVGLYKSIISQLSTNVHYSRDEMCSSDMFTYTYTISRIYLENKEGYCPSIFSEKCLFRIEYSFFTNNFQTTGFGENYKEQNISQRRNRKTKTAICTFSKCGPSSFLVLSYKKNVKTFFK